jgi:uncharacterized protein (TIGR03435 family)
MKSKLAGWAVVFFVFPHLLAQSPRSPEFDAASVRPHPRAGPGTMMRETPGNLNYIGIPLMSVVARAYNVEGLQVVGPPWLYSETYDIKATLPADTPPAQRQLMLRGLLAQRFQLAVHHEKRELTAYVLVAGKGGVKMHPAEDSAPSFRPYADAEGRHIRGRITMSNLAGQLSYQVGGPVSDETGLEEVFDITLDYSVDEKPAAEFAGAPTIFTALQQQLGLKLESKKALFDMIIVDRAEKVPTAN